MDSIELNDGTLVECTYLTETQFVKLKSNVVQGAIESFKIKYQAEVYQFPDGSVIASKDGIYVQFNSLDDLKSVLDDTNEDQIVTSILHNKNPFGELFPNHTFQLIRQLTDSLQMPEGEPVNAQLLKDIDSKISDLPNPSIFKKKFFINLVAVVGEVICKEHNIKWRMILSDDKQTWHPYLYTPKKPIEFFSYLYEDIYESNRQGSILFEAYQTANDIYPR
ncbi:hypothetical protein [Mucilaginibacter sp.]|uniref:hypothetical protein n=1 Tax=Mucilaginibacter sp. TaxID=1882438 RepID=UPI0035BBB175